MILAALHQVDKHYGEQTVLASAHVELRAGQRLALIGRNGSGKTTVLRLLAGAETPDGGDVFVRPDVTLGVLDQDPRFDEGVTVGEVADEAFGELDAMEAELERLEGAGLDDPATYEAWEPLHERFERRGGYARRARRDAVLHALGFAGRTEEPVRRLSGGERTRLGLARLLMAQPDLLLLDEPTNHLDLAMRAWLEGFVARYPGTAVLVSHDRAFLDGACDTTAEIDRGEMRVMSGPPSVYRIARAEQARIEARTRANQAKERERLASAAAQMKQWAGQNAKLHRRARAMERRVERYETSMLDEAQPDAPTTRFTFPCPDSVDLVLHAEHLTARYDRTLFEDVSVVVRRGERVAITGPNGAGKTTFLRVLLGERASDDPRARVAWGVRVKVAYYDQDLAGVDPDATLIEELIRLVGDVEAHNLLGRFLFPYEAQFKRVRDLSGGERARVALLKLTLAQANVLVLDEPTNHLDVEMIEALEAALAAFEGTVLLVSHDRRFLDALANRVWEVDDGRFLTYEGDWSFYGRKRDERRGLEATERAEATSARSQPAPTTRPPDALTPWQQRRERERLEGEVARLEATLAEVVAELHAVSAAMAPTPGAAEGGASIVGGAQGQGAERLAELGSRHDEVERALLEAIAAWERLEVALDDGAPDRRVRADG